MGMDVMNLMKYKPIRIKGKNLEKLHNEVFELDGGKCCLTGEHHAPVYIAPGTPAHHVNHGKNKEDVKENMIMLCTSCHDRAHTKDSNHIKTACKVYLRKRDGENRWNT
jgi:hypothetical protein